jgi:hypothetical protein
VAASEILPQKRWYALQNLLFHLPFQKFFPRKSAYKNQTGELNRDGIAAYFSKKGFSKQ